MTNFNNVIPSVSLSVSVSLLVESMQIGLFSSVGVGGMSLAFGSALLQVTVIVTVASVDAKLSFVSQMLYSYVSVNEFINDDANCFCYNSYYTIISVTCYFINTYYIVTVIRISDESVN